MSFLNVSSFLSAIAVFVGANSGTNINGNCGSAGLGSCGSGIFSPIRVISDMEMPVSVYEKLKNDSLHLLLSSIAPGTDEYVSLLQPSTSTYLVTTVQGISEIEFGRFPLLPETSEVTLPLHRKPVKRNDQVALHLNLSPEEAGTRVDGSSRSALVHSSEDMAPRAVSTTHPLIEYLKTPSSSCMAAKFRSLSVKPVYQFYDPKDGREGVLSATLRLGQETTTNTYEGHEFYFTTELPGRAQQRSGGVSSRPKEVARFVMQPDQVTYLIMNDEDDPEQIPGNLAHRYRETAAHHARELQFLRKYKASTGIEYKHFYGYKGPRAPPGLFMYPAEYIGQTHRVQSPETHWHCDGPAEMCQGAGVAAGDSRLNLTLEVVSTAPRALAIENFFSEFEADHLIALSRDHIRQSGVGDGQTGQHDSDTRTSKNTWLKRDRDAITNSLYVRAADLLQLDEAILHTNLNHMRVPGQSRSAVEDIQVVNYQVGQEYMTHHDWGVSGYPESRFLTLLLYLSDPASEHAGGETSFPKSNSSSQFQVIPRKGTAVLFYNLLEDGNGDDLAAHAAKVVRKGEKWLANFWVWDPTKKG